jgi:Ricin-type beta-trefoil lectin domain
MVMALAGVLAAGCIDQKEEPKPAAPAAAAALPPEPPRSAMQVSPTTSYTVVGAASNKCLQYVAGGAADGARAEIRTCDGSKAQSFTLRAVAGGYYEFVSALGTNECLDVPAFLQEDGAGVQQWQCNGGANQHWIIADAAPDAIRLVAQHSGKVLAVNGENTGDGSLVGQWAWKSGSNQRFKLQPVVTKAAETKDKGGTGGGSGAKTGKAKKSKTAAAPAAAHP